jgi:hypothetical protein
MATQERKRLEKEAWKDGKSAMVGESDKRLSKVTGEAGEGMDESQSDSRGW